MGLKDFQWGTGLLLIGFHAALFASLPAYILRHPAGGGVIVSAAVLFVVTMMSLTALYHRHYSHRAYRPRRPVEAVLLFFATMTMQGSALRWAHDHRHHHRFVDTDRDPYSIKRGFWHAHMLWLFHKPIPFSAAMVPDLLENRLVRIQDRHYGWLRFATNLLACALVGWLAHDLVGAFVLGWGARLFVSLHSTWFINSLAHTWGARTYSREQSAVNNYVLAFLTSGEGYHNYHHTFAADYRNGVEWYQFDPTKWLIWGLHKTSLAHDLRQASPFTIRRRLLMADMQVLLEHVRARMGADREAWEQAIRERAERVSWRISAAADELARYRALKRARAGKARLHAAQAQVRACKAVLRAELQAWAQLSRNVLRAQAA